MSAAAAAAPLTLTWMPAEKSHLSLAAYAYFNAMANGHSDEFLNTLLFWPQSEEARSYVERLPLAYEHLFNDAPTMTNCQKAARLFVLVTEAQSVVGMALLFCHSAESAWLSSIAVLPAHRRCGAARSFIDYAKTTARVLKLAVKKRQSDAVACLSALGFTPSLARAVTFQRTLSGGFAGTERLEKVENTSAEESYFFSYTSAPMTV